METQVQSKHAQAFMLETEPLLFSAPMTQLYMKHDSNGPAKRKHITSTKLLYCTEAIVALMMHARLMSIAPPLPQDEITTVVIDEVRSRSAHNDYVLALTLAVMQKTSDLRFVLMSATGASA